VLRIRALIQPFSIVVIFLPWLFIPIISPFCKWHYSFAFTHFHFHSPRYLALKEKIFPGSTLCTTTHNKHIEVLTIKDFGFSSFPLLFSNNNTRTTDPSLGTTRSFRKMALRRLHIKPSVPKEASTSEGEDEVMDDEDEDTDEEDDDANEEDEANEENDAVEKHEVGDEHEIIERILSAIDYSKAKKKARQSVKQTTRFTLSKDTDRLALNLLREATNNGLAKLIFTTPEEECYEIAAPDQPQHMGLDPQWWEGKSAAEIRAGPLADGEDIEVADSFLKKKKAKSGKRNEKRRVQRSKKKVEDKLAEGLRRQEAGERMWNESRQRRR
jgi:hypothetical protein